MPLTEKQKRLAMQIDQHVQRTVANGGDDEDLLVSMYDHMPTFKPSACHWHKSGDERPLSAV